MIELTKSELFKDLTYIQCLEKGIDLHNDYLCSDIVFDNQEQSLRVYFEPIASKSDPIKRLYIVFNDASISKFELFFNRTSDSSTINNFYRGRFEIAGQLVEFSENGDVYFYIEFEEGDKFELFASTAFLKEE